MLWRTCSGCSTQWAIASKMRVIGRSCYSAFRAAFGDLKSSGWMADLEKVRQGMIVHLRWSKTDQDGTGRKIGIPFGRTRFCPVLTVERLLEISRIEASAIFRPINDMGRSRRDAYQATPSVSSSRTGLRSRVSIRLAFPGIASVRVSQRAPRRRAFRHQKPSPKPTASPTPC